MQKRSHFYLVLLKAFNNDAGRMLYAAAGAVVHRPFQPDGIKITFPTLGHYL